MEIFETRSLDSARATSGKREKEAELEIARLESNIKNRKTRKKMKNYYF